MKKIIFAILLVIGITAYANAQNLLCADYAGTDVRDTISIAGSTNAGSGWFLNSTGASTIYAQLWNGTMWVAVKVNFDCKYVTKLAAYHWGADTTISIYGYMYNGQSVALPLEVGYNTFNWKADLVALNGVNTAVWWVQFFALKD